MSGALRYAPIYGRGSECRDEDKKSDALEVRRFRPHTFSAYCLLPGLRRRNRSRVTGDCALSCASHLRAGINRVIPMTPNLRWLLFFSLVGNGLLATAWVWSGAYPRDKATQGVQANTSASVANHVAKPPSSAAAPLGEAAALSSADEPRAVRDALKAAGVSKELIRRFVRDAVWAKYSRAEPPKAWWKQDVMGSRFVMTPPSTMKAVEVEIKALVGEDDRVLPTSERLAFLTDEKRKVLTRTLMDYEEMAADIRADMMNFQMPEDQKRMKLLAEECERDLHAVLTPEEFDEVMLSKSAAGQRSQMIAGQLDLSEAEFREVVKLRREADRLASANPSQTSVQSREAEQRFEADLTRLVGEERMRTQTLKNSRDYEVLQKAQARLGLSQEVMDGVLGQRDYARAATEEITASATPVAAKRQELKKVAAGVKAEVTRLLGPAGAEGYFMQNGMSWLRDLERGQGVRFAFNGYAESIEVK